MGEAPESFPASQPAREARRLLSEALGQLQVHGTRSAEMDAAVEQSARASSLLFDVESGDKHGESAHLAIRDAIEALSSTMRSLEGAARDPVVLTALETVARTLALLYPVAQAQQRARRNVVFHDSGAPGGTESLPPFAVPPAPPVLGRPRKRTPHSGGSEQRARGDRVFVECDVGLLSDSHFYTGLSEDIATGGLFIATYHPKPAGTHVTLYFALPSGRVVHADGVVRWIRDGSPGTPPGMGVAFEGLSEADDAAIREFCANRAPMYHDSGDV